ncbi:MAG: Ferrochelatase 1 [Acidimicrobiales bacterium]|nr:MAG: ferrochelatase [Actinomycetota bacterium]MBV6508525.1 Ferrochelatase 1 [Acidimicrobiales bacterium]RIK05159.1 MAG: ferrochelatase [Acidobacteriota bacterium]
MSSRVGVLVMAYGSPAGPDAIEAFLTHIGRGRAPSPAEVADLRRRYRAIGGLSPLAARTEAQRSKLASLLGETLPGVVVARGNRHAPPFIEDAVGQLADSGVSEIVGLVMAPHFSTAGVGQYLERCSRSAGQRGLGFHGIESWHLLEEFVDFLARGVTAELDRMPAATTVLFSAHSLPERVLTDDPYEPALRESAGLAARRAGLHPCAGWSLTWQSAGPTPEPWRGPDVTAVIRQLAETGRSEGVVVCPQGFVSDHLEVLYDLDIEARGVAEAVGLRFARTPVVNDDTPVMRGLAALIAARVGSDRG